MLSLEMSFSKLTLTQKYALLASSTRGHDILIYQTSKLFFSFMRNAFEAPLAKQLVPMKAAYLCNNASNVNKLVSFSCYPGSDSALHICE